MMQLTRLASELKAPDNPDNRYLYYRQLAKFTIESSRDVHFNLDGEPIQAKKIRYEVLPGAIKLVLPENCPMIKSCS